MTTEPVGGRDANRAPAPAAMPVRATAQVMQGGAFTVASLPWATLRGPMHVGAMRLRPFGEAAGRGAVPASLATAVDTILTADARPRPVDRHSVPVVWRDGAEPLAEIDDLAAAALFEFRTQMIFTALATRRFFDVRYLSRHDIRLVAPRVVVIDREARNAHLPQRHRQELSAVARIVHWRQ